jgi:hypothetical protein
MLLADLGSRTSCLCQPPVSIQSRFIASTALMTAFSIIGCIEAGAVCVTFCDLLPCHTKMDILLSVFVNLTFMVILAVLELRGSAELKT